jgi:hypothetical protein
VLNSVAAPAAWGVTGSCVTAPARPMLP